MIAPDVGIEVGDVWDRAGREAWDHQVIRACVLCPYTDQLTTTDSFSLWGKTESWVEGGQDVGSGGLKLGLLSGRLGTIDPFRHAWESLDTTRD